MDPVAQAILLSWNFDPWLILPLVLTGSVYLRGWWLLRAKLPRRFHLCTLTAFQSGLIVVFLASSSPIDAFSSLFLSVHMVQHILLTMVAPPLLLLGAPMLPLLRGLPRSGSRHFIGPLLRTRPLTALADFLVRPVAALGLFSVATIAWHVPVLYELALRSVFWHQIEHFCFFGTGLLFWWPVVQPWPSRPHWSGWAMILYLLAADLVNTAVSAVLCFAERVLYPTYAAAPKLWGISPLSDQAVAGAIMWVAGSLAFLLPVGWILNTLLEPSLVSPPLARSRPHRFGSIRGRLLLLPLALASWHFLQPPAMHAHHGGVVQFKQTADPYTVTLFSEDKTLYEGAVELAILVQTAEGEPVLDAAVDLELSHPQLQPIESTASRADSSNRLMYGTKPSLPAAGTWTAAIRVRRGERVTDVAGELRVEAARNRVPAWPYFVVSGGILAAAAWIAWRNRERHE